MDIRVKDIIKDNSVWLPSKDYNTKKPKLSILMPTYGRGKNGFFKRAVKSYIEQTFKDTELIIVDDANTDGTSEQIDEFMKQDDRISCIRHKKNMGLPSISSYEALKMARGEYIGFLFDDCVLYPSAYERTLKRMEEEGAQASYGRVFLHSDIDDTSKGTMVYYIEEFLDNLEISNFIGNITIIFKKDILKTVGYIDPHVTLSRVNDWDFITRIKRKFHLIETGVLFASEYGATQKSSLGNSYLMNLLAIDEYLKTPNREKNLFLDKYEEMNVFSEQKNSSYNFSLELKKTTKFFKNKYWMNSIENMDEMNFLNDNIVIKNAGGDILSSSITLIFNKNANDLNQDIFSYISLDKNIAGARAVILVRESNMNSFLLRKLKYAGIPVYFMWDDDFIMLSKENVPGLDLTETNFKKASKNLQGLIFTSKNFYYTYKQKNYNKNNYLLNPIYLEKIEKEISLIKNETLNIAFTGGYWRLKGFENTLIKILNAVSENIDVVLHIPESTELKEIFYVNREKIRFKIIWYDFTFSYDQLINKLGKKDIHILIHPAQQNKNNINKTKNSLITASLLGAGLITTDEAPYNTKDSEDDPMPYLLASNNEKYWIEAITQLIDNETRINIVKNARNYCKKRYSASCLDELIQDILKNTPKVDIGLYSDRLEKLAYFSGKESPEVFMNHNISGLGEDIIATKKIDKNLKTYFISDKKEFSKISIIFGTHNKKILGTCEIEIYDNNNNRIHQSTISLDKIEDNAFYNIYTGYIDNAMGEKFYILFNFNYKSSNKISVYERNYKYSNNRIIRNIIRPFKINEIYVVLS
jgi:glycosyltransferase, family 2